MESASNAASPPARDYQVAVSNSVTLILRQGALWTLNGVLVLFLPRYLGDEGLGQLQFGLSFSALFAVIVALGLRQYLTKEVARDHSRSPEMLGTAIALRILASLVAYAAVIGVIQLTGYSGIARRVVYLTAAAMVVVSFARLMAAFLHGYEDMASPALGEIAGKVVVVVVGIAVLVSGRGVVAYSAVLLGGAFMHLAANAAFLQRRTPLRVNFDRASAVTMVKGGLPFILMVLILEIYNHADVVILRALTTDRVVGWYAGALQFYRTAEMFPEALTTALLPTLARIHISGSLAGNTIARRAILAVAIVVMPASLALSFLAPQVIALLPYPESFSNSVPVLTLLALTIPATSFLMLIGMVVIAVDRQKAWAIALGATLVLDIVLDLVTIPLSQRWFGNGGIGAASTTLFAELLMVGVGIYLLPRGVIDRSLGRGLVRTLLAGLAMLAVGYGAIVAGIHPVVATIFGVAAFTAIVAATRTVTIADFRYVINIARARALVRGTAPAGGSQ